MKSTTLIDRYVTYALYYTLLERYKNKLLNGFKFCGIVTDDSGNGGWVWESDKEEIYAHPWDCDGNDGMTIEIYDKDKGHLETHETAFKVSELKLDLDIDIANYIDILSKVLSNREVIA